MNKFDAVENLVVFERAELDDFLSIAELDRQTWGHNTHGAYIPDGEHAWRIWCEHALVFVAKNAERKPVGAVLAFLCLNGDFCVHKAMVDESVRGRGIGLRLFDVLFEELDKNSRACFLTVDPVNEAAKKLYEKQGFSVRDHIKGYYRPHEDRLVMVRQGK